MLRRKGLDDEPTQTVKLTSSKPFAVKGAKDAAGLLDVRVTTTGEATEHVLEVALSEKGAAKKRFGGSITVTTTLPSQPELVIPVYVMTVVKKPGP
jgi:hypothetical protein